MSTESRGKKLIEIKTEFKNIHNIWHFYSDQEERYLDIISTQYTIETQYLEYKLHFNDTRNK